MGNQSPGPKPRPPQAGIRYKLCSGLQLKDCGTPITALCVFLARPSRAETARSALGP